LCVALCIGFAAISFLTPFIRVPDQRVTLFIAMTVLAASLWLLFFLGSVYFYRLQTLWLLYPAPAAPVWPARMLASAFVHHQPQRPGQF
jgi:hypothetical protein